MKCCCSQGQRVKNVKHATNILFKLICKNHIPVKTLRENRCMMIPLHIHVLSYTQHNTVSCNTTMIGRRYSSL